MPSLSNLDPAEAEARAGADKLEDYGGNGAVRHPDIRLFPDGSDNHAPSCPFQEAAAALFSPGEPPQQCFIDDEDKPLGIDAARGRRAKSSLLEQFDLFLFYLPILESSDAASTSQYVEHSDHPVSR
jgi:hypothetical protein